MTLRILPIFSACATLTLFSCYPYPEPPQGGPRHPEQTVTSPEQQKIEEQRKRLKEEQAALEKKKQEEATGTLPSDPTAPTKPPTEKKQDYPFATSVPGKEGFVFSPYNNKVVDVRDIPKGTLVQDPTYPAAEKKYFRVP